MIEHSPAPLLRRCLSRSNPWRRYYANVPSDEPFFHREWPQHKNPSPYDVFGMNPTEFEPSKLKKKYYEIAKLYHPDTSSAKTVLSHEGSELSDIHKSERFKMLTDAYTLLKDSKKRAMYDQFKSGWSNGMSTTTTSYRTDTQVYQYDYRDHRYWNASTWEDYQNLRDMNDPALRKDKMRALAGIFLIMFFGASIQGWYFLNRMEGVLIARQDVHDACEADLMQAYLNYGLDDSRLNRIRRFLWFRTFGMYRTREALDASAKRDEKILNEIMAAKQ